MSEPLSPDDANVAVSAFLLGTATRIILAAKSGEANTPTWQKWADEFLSLVEDWMKSDDK